MLKKISFLTAFLIIVFFFVGSIVIILYQFFMMERDFREFETIILPIEEMKLYKEEIKYQKENGF